MATEKDDEAREPRIRDKRKIDPSTGEARDPQPDASDDASARAEEPLEEDGAATDAEQPEELIQAEDADVELSDDDLAQLLDAGERDLVAEYRERAARAEAELVNFRTRVERDRAANRDAVIAEVVRSLLPAIDDLDRADAHGDLTEGSPLAIVAQKLRAGFDRYGLRRVGEKGEPFDPKLHEALVQLPSADVTTETIADVIEPGYALGERLIRAAKVAVSVPEG
ncbi:MAG: nucleotide exchange factor GrpE [Actinomycetales bacterium]|nr:nucleotide exchange factor GrpE [Actinomycetales bacterium]